MADDSRGRASRLRQQLRRTEQEHSRLLQRLVEERGPLIPGSYVLQAGRCGKPSCKCTRGELHPRATLYHSDQQGVRRGAYVPQADRQRVERLNRRDRGFRQARAALAKLARNTLELADALRDVLTEPYPPSRQVRRKAKSGKRRSPGREDPSS